MTRTAETMQLLHDIYRAVYDQFALDTGDIAKEFSIPKREAYRLCNILRDANLLCGEVVNGARDVTPNRYGSKGGKANPGVDLTWQAWETYDSIDEEEAEALFTAKLAT